MNDAKQTDGGAQMYHLKGEHPLEVLAGYVIAGWMQRDLRIVRLLFCLVVGSLVLPACTQEQVGSGIREYAIAGDPEAAHECLHEGDGACWAHLHWSHAQHFCKIALETATPQPLRWEDVPLDDPLLEHLVESVPGIDLVLMGKGSPAFYQAFWSDRPMGQLLFKGAYDLQSRTGINTWTPWAYSCVYDTFRYEVVDVSVEPIPDR